MSFSFAWDIKCPWLIFIILFYSELSGFYSPLLELLCVHIFGRFCWFPFVLFFFFFSIRWKETKILCLARCLFSHIPLRKFPYQPHGAAPAFPFPHVLSLQKTRQCTFLIHSLADKWIFTQALRKAPPPNQRFCLFQMPSCKSPLRYLLISLLSLNFLSTKL